MAIEKKKAKEDEVAQTVDSVFNEESHNEVKKTEELTNEEIAVEDKTDSEAMFSASDVEELLKNTEERLTNKFQSMFQKLGLSNAKSELSKEEAYISELEDDWMDVPATFFAYSINFSIHGDRRLGKEVIPPQGAIKFKPIVRSKRQGRKGDEVISVSSVKVHSRSVANYLRNHSAFGISFFESMDAVLNINTEWAQKLVEANSAIQRLSDQGVIARTRQEGLPIGTDIGKMRKELVERVALSSMRQQERNQYQNLKNSVIEKDTGRAIIEKTVNI